MRTMTWRMKRALRAPVRRPALLVRVEIGAVVNRVWSGLEPLDYDGDEWIGVGHIGAVEGIEQTAELQIQELRFAFTGVPESADTVPASPIKGGRVQGWLALLDDDGHVIPDPVIVADASLDYPVSTVGDDGTSTRVLYGRSGMTWLEREIALACTAEDLKAEYSDDTGFDNIHELPNDLPKWTKT